MQVLSCRRWHARICASQATQISKTVAGTTEGKLIDTQHHNIEESFPPCPLFVDLAGVRCVVVGAGRVALRKVESLLSYGADVVVIAPEAENELRALATQGRIEWQERPFAEGDCAGARLVVCATNVEEVNSTVHAEGCAANALVNVVDVPELCNTIVPAVVRRGKLQVAVSTAGAAPSVARTLRMELEDRFAAHWEAYLDVMAEVRGMIKQRVPGPAKARTHLYEALTASDLEQRFAAGERPSADEVYAAYVAPLEKGGAR